ELLPGRLVVHEHARVGQDRATTGQPDPAHLAADLGRAGARVARDGEIVDDRVVLGPDGDAAGARVPERARERLAEMALQQVAAAVVDALADDVTGERGAELGAVADDARRFVHHRLVAECDRARGAVAGRRADRVEDRRRWRVERAGIDRGLRGDGADRRGDGAGGQ